MPLDASKRSDAPEIMDDFDMEGEVLRDALDKIASINRMLGGNKVTLEGLLLLLKNTKPGVELRILDVGCGNGDMLRALADYGLKQGLRFLLTGIDANKFTLQYASDLSASYPNISYFCADIFEEIKQAERYDVILCTLTLHHFKDQEIITLLSGFCAKADLGIVINDLHRSALAYRLFQLLCLVFRLNKMSREDGLVSILRGFKREDLLSYARQLNLRDFVLRWSWAFRYQWIIKTR